MQNFSNRLGPILFSIPKAEENHEKIEFRQLRKKPKMLLDLNPLRDLNSRSASKVLAVWLKDTAFSMISDYTSYIVLWKINNRILFTICLKYPNISILQHYIAVNITLHSVTKGGSTIALWLKLSDSKRQVRHLTRL